MARQVNTDQTIQNSNMALHNAVMSTVQHNKGDCRGGAVGAPVQAFCNGDPRSARKDKSQLHQKRRSPWMLLTRHLVSLGYGLRDPAAVLMSRYQWSSTRNVPEQPHMTMSW